MNSTINTKVSEINSRIDALDTRVKTLEDSLSAIKSQISALQDEINALKSKLANIIGRMVSISHIPTYADGAENVPCSMSGSTIVPGSFTLRFEIQPASLAADLAANWSTALSVKAVYTKTRASAGDFVTLPVEGATASDGILSVTVFGADLDNDAFVHRNNPVSVRLKISDGTNEMASDYVQLTPVGADYIDKNGINFGPGIIIDDVIWAPVNCGATESEQYGKYYTLSNHRAFDDVREACPEGWQLPSCEDFLTLRERATNITINNNTKGVWFSNREVDYMDKYRKDIVAVFFPASGSMRMANDNPLGKESSGEYWTSESQFDSNAYEVSNVWLFYNTGKAAIETTLHVSYANGLSVRCVKK